MTGRGGKIKEARNAMRIIAEEGVKIKFLLQPTRTKAFWSTQRREFLKALTTEFDLDVWASSEGSKSLGVRLGSPSFVRHFLPDKFKIFGDAIALTVTIKDGLVEHNIHLVTASASE